MPPAMRPIQPLSTPNTLLSAASSSSLPSLNRAKSLPSTLAHPKSGGILMGAEKGIAIEIVKMRR